MKIRDAMHHPPETCAASTTLTEAARRLLVRDLGTLVVLDENGSLAGLITDRDLGVKGYARRLSADATVADVMSHDVVTVDADGDVFDAAATMAARGIRRLPVLDGGAVVGVIALDDLTQLLGKEAFDLARAVSAQSDPRHYAGWTTWDAG